MRCQNNSFFPRIHNFNSPFENIAEKEEIARYQALLLSLQWFLAYQKEIPSVSLFENALKSEKSKIP